MESKKNDRKKSFLRDSKAFSSMKGFQLEIVLNILNKFTKDTASGAE